MANSAELFNVAREVAEGLSPGLVAGVEQGAKSLAQEIFSATRQLGSAAERTPEALFSPGLTFGTKPLREGDLTMVSQTAVVQGAGDAAKSVLAAAVRPDLLLAERAPEDLMLPKLSIQDGSQTAGLIESNVRAATDRILDRFPSDQTLVALGRDMRPLLQPLRDAGRQVVAFDFHPLDSSASTRWHEVVPPNSVVLDSGFVGRHVSAIRSFDPTIQLFNPIEREVTPTKPANRILPHSHFKVSDLFPGRLDAVD